MPASQDDDKRERLAAIGEIAAEIAHELRNALQVISANVFLAKQNPAASEPQLMRIERNARAAHAIVDDLMALARGEPAHAEPILLVDVLVAGREDMPDPGAVFEDRLEDHGLRVRAHPGLLTRLFHVLYENAVHASQPRQPRVRTCARRVARDVVIEVSDDGPGIPANLAETLFEPLVTGRTGGTGLGLALAKRVVAAHGGTITCPAGDVRADEPTSLPGALFRISLRGAD